MDQPDDFDFEYDVDEAVRQFVDQYPSEGNAHTLEDDPGDRFQRPHELPAQMPGRLSVVQQVTSQGSSSGFPATLQVSSCKAGSFETTTTKADEIDQPPWEPSWGGEALPTRPTQTLPISQHVQSSQSNLDPSANFQFLSGAVVLEDRSKASKQKRSLDERSGFKCEHPGCTYRGSFTRKYELQRHSLKHTARTKYQCPIDLCKKLFYRTDKFRLHLRRSHKDDDEASCPVPECSTNGLPWILIKLHVRNHYPAFHTAGPSCAIFELITFLDSNERACPVQSCQQDNITAQSMRNHLQSHNVRERIENERHILEAGYDPISAKVCCPICQTLCATKQDFEDHIEIIHIVKDWTHLCKFRDSYSKNHYKVSWTWAEMPHPMLIQDVCCSDMKTDPKHHLKYLQDPEELRPYRITLLKLWPKLGSHPIFDDIMPKVEQRGWRRMQ